MKNDNEIEMNELKSNKGEIAKNIIFITSKPGSFCFDKNSYDEVQLGFLISKLEYDKIIEDASKIMGNALLKKRKFDTFQTPIIIKILSSISFVLVCFYLFLTYASLNSDKGEAMLAIGLFALLLAILITLTQSIYNFCRKTRTYKTLEEIIKEDLDSYFVQINSTYYFSKINNKYIFSGALNFCFIPKNKHIKCVITKVDGEDNNNHEDNKNKIHKEHKRSDTDKHQGIQKEIVKSSDSKQKIKHQRVKSALSMKSKDGKSYLSAQEIELELNK
jgi:hypothetical protein